MFLYCAAYLLVNTMVYKSKYMLFLYFSIATVSTRKVAEVISVKSVDREYIYSVVYLIRV